MTLRDTLRLLIRALRASALYLRWRYAIAAIIAVDIAKTLLRYDILDGFIYYHIR